MDLHQQELEVWRRRRRERAGLVCQEVARLQTLVYTDYECVEVEQVNRSCRSFTFSIGDQVLGHQVGGTLAQGLVQLRPALKMMLIPPSAKVANEIG